MKYNSNISHILILFIILTCLISCENRQERENKLITISLNKANAENKKLSETIEEIRYLKLNTPGDGDLIGKIDKLLFYRDLIIILDKGISKSVYVFNNKGNFLTKIGKIGDGPGEYQMPQDVTLDKKNNEIIIYCSYSQKLSYFSLDGQLQREKKIGLRFRGMHFLKENKLAIFTQCIYNYQDNLAPFHMILLFVIQQVKYCINNFEINLSLVPVLLLFQQTHISLIIIMIYTFHGSLMIQYTNLIITQ